MNEAKKIEEFSAQKIEKLIDYHNRVYSTFPFDEEYQAIFASEGARKTKYIIEDLLFSSKKAGVSLNKFAYLCIGAADGSEPESVLQSTEISHAIMIEKSDSATDKAKRKAENLIEIDKHLLVLTGDANQRLDDAISKLEELKEQEHIGGLVLSTQAILHELRTRSPEHDLPVFLGRCFGVFKNNAFYAREPMFPDRWPDKVELLLPGVTRDRLKTFSSIVNNELKITDKPIHAVGNDYVNMSSILALEVLHKFLRSRSVPEFIYELGEQLTSINPYYIQSLIQKDLKDCIAHVEPFITEGFEDAWRKYHIKVRTPDGQSLTIPHTHARITAFSIREKDAVTKSQSGNEKIEIINNVTGLSNDYTDTTAQLDREFIDCRKDSKGETRRKEIKSILTRLNGLQNDSFSCHELRARLWWQLSLEARNLKDFSDAMEETRKSFDAIFKCNLTPSEKDSAINSWIEWTVDFSQSAGSDVALNKIIVSLDKAIRYLGMQIGPNIYSKPAETVSHFLYMRAKAKRALASLYKRRSPSNRRKINDCKKKALQDAKRSYELHKNQISQLEYALSLFSNSRTVFTGEANLGMTLLTEAFDKGPYLLPGYELVKQFNLRHESEAAIKVFNSIAELDDNIRRFHANVTYFAASVIGMYYSGVNADAVKQNAFQALKWIDETISYEHHTAREVVDYCYLKAICGFPVRESLEFLDHLKPASETAWNDLAKMAQKVSQGDRTAGKALLLGLEDATIWNRIGTLYSDFTEDFQKAIDFYNRASLIAPNSPVFYFNRARTLAYRLYDYGSAKTYLDRARNLITSDRGLRWYKSNEGDFLKLEAEIRANTSE